MLRITCGICGMPLKRLPYYTGQKVNAVRLLQYEKPNKAEVKYYHLRCFKKNFIYRNETERPNEDDRCICGVTNMGYPRMFIDYGYYRSDSDDFQFKYYKKCHIPCFEKYWMPHYWK